MNRLVDIDSETRKAVSVFIERIARQYEMDGAILFGSRARKSHHAESDADVAVLLHGHGGEFVSTKLAMADVAYEVLLETGIRIQPLPTGKMSGSILMRIPTRACHTILSVKVSVCERPRLTWQK